jgi:type VI secretion system ImpM family protein
MRAFDAWVQRGLVEARRRLGAELPHAVESAGATCFFVEVPNTPHALAGALRPSRDRSGRRYPFLVAVEVEKHRLDGRRLPSWPDRYDTFFRTAAALVDDAVEGRLAAEGLPGELQRLRAVYDRTPFPVDYEFRLRQATSDDLWTRTWGDAEDGRKYVVVKNLTEALARVGRSRSAKLPVAFRFPLPRPPQGLDVSFWLETCWRLLGTPPDAPAYFWSLSDEAELVLASAPSVAGVFVHLLGADGRDGALVPLDDADGQPAALAVLALPPHVGTLLEEDGVSLHAFIYRMHS